MDRKIKVPWKRRYFVAGPTRDQTKDIYWDDLKALIPKKWVRRTNESLLFIELMWGARIYVVGLDKPQRIEGRPWDGGIVDEYADTKVGTFAANIRPAIADRKGWLWFIGVPDMDKPNQIEYEKMWIKAASGTDPEWAGFRWPSVDIMSPEEIESARRDTPDDIFDQEYGGQFVLAAGRAFPEFDPTIDIQPAPYQPALPICWSLDFNVNPMCAGVIQHHKGKVWVIDEIVLRQAHTKVACDAFLDRAEKNNWNLTNLEIYGDATGNARDSTSGETDWTIIVNRLSHIEGVRLKVPSSNSLVKDTLNAVKGRILNADGERNLIISPKCKQLAQDMCNAIWPSDLEPQHCLSWLRYFIDYKYPVKRNRKSSDNRIGAVA